MGGRAALPKGGPGGTVPPGRRAGGSGGGRPPEVNSVNTKLGQVFGGQVDAAVAVVLADVAQDVRQLERDAEGVGQLGRPVHVIAGAEDAQGQAADRAGHAAAVPEQVIEGLVAGAAHVGDAAVDELAEGGDGDGEAARHVGQGQQHRVVRGRPGEVEDLLPRDLQGGDLLPGRHRAVADVVDPPGERVDDGQASPLVRRQQPDAVREVPGRRPGDPFAFTVRLGQFHYRPLV